jgi:uncharacterized protein YndB with AHSA1/START domain
MIDVKTIGNDQIVAEMTIEASPETIFAALTQPEKLSAWWGDDRMYRADKWSIDLRVGGKWRSEGGPVGQPSRILVEGEYLEIDPPRVLAYTWRPTWVEAPVTTVRYVLTPQGNGTHIVMTHSGFAGNQKAMEAHQGWPQVLGWLKGYAEK